MHTVIARILSIENFTLSMKAVRSVITSDVKVMTVILCKTLILFMAMGPERRTIFMLIALLWRFWA